VTNRHLQAKIDAKEFFKGGEPDSVEGVKYDFHTGRHVLKAGIGPVDFEELSATEKEQLKIEPGEVVFILTREYLDLPPNILVQLAPKRSLSHRGILTLGGLCVDPGYKGHLLIGLYNLSTTRYPLRPDEKIIGATFLELENTELGDFPKQKSAFDKFPTDLVDVMERYKPVVLHELKEEVGTLQTEFQALSKRIDSREDFYRKLERATRTNTDNIKSLTDSLKAEKKAREDGEKEINKTLTSLQRTAWMANAIGTAFLAIAIAVISNWIWSLW